MLIDWTQAQHGPPGDEARQSLCDIVGRIMEQLSPVDDSSEPTLVITMAEVDGEFFTDADPGTRTALRRAYQGFLDDA
jgi:hypothetical protein